jgi:hypothetical protein
VRPLATLAILAPLVAGCIGPCNIVEGCPTWTEDRARDNPLVARKVEELERSQLRSTLQPGDDVRFEGTDGKRYRGRIKTLEAEAVVLWGKDARLYRVPYTFISKLGVMRKKDAGEFVADVIYTIVSTPTMLLGPAPGL